MPSTSPYTQNDYTAVGNYRPYELPVNDIFKAISAQNQFWDEGAAKVKSVYDDALNLNLTLDSNIEIRKKFMQDADKQLTKLSGMDLSDPSVQRQGFGIYRPIFKDKSIMYDDYLTKKKQEVLSEADKWKNDMKTNGAGFSMDNLAYALRPLRDFNSKTSRDQLETIYNSAQNTEYTPYYDVSKERLDLLDKCKPDVTSHTSVNGMYMNTDKRSSLTSQKLWGCLESGLSDKAKQQIRISGVVRYGDDYESLKKDYIDAATDKKKYLSDEMKNLYVQKAAFDGKKGYEDYTKGLDEQIKMHNDGISKLDGDLNSYSTWDNNYMKKNYEDLASFAYFRRANGAFADFFAKNDVEQSMKADPVGIMYYTQQKLDDRQNASFTHDYQMEDYKFRQKLMSGEGNMDEATRLRMLKNNGVSDSQLYSLYGTAVMEPGSNFEALNGELSVKNAAMQSKASDLLQFVNQDPNLAQAFKGITTADGFLKEVPKLEENIRLALAVDPNDVKANKLKNGLNTFIRLANERTQTQSIIEDAQTYTEKAIEHNFSGKKQELDNELQSINGGNAFPLTLWKKDDQGYLNYHDKIVVNKTPSEIVQDIRDGKASLYKDAGVIRVNYGNYGIEIQRNRIFGNASDVVGAKEMRSQLAGISNYLDKNNKVINEISDFKKNTLDTYLGKNTAVQNMKFAAGNLLGTGKIDDPKMTPTMRQISGIFGQTLGGDVTFNTIGGFDAVNGWVDVQATDSKHGLLSSDKLLTAAADSKYGAGIFEQSNIPNAIRIKLPNLAILTPPKYGDTVRKLLSYSSSKVTSENIPQGLLLDAGITPEGNKVQIKTTKNLADSSAEYSILLNGKEIVVKEGNNEASTISFVDKLLNGELEKEIKQ